MKKSILILTTVIFSIVTIGSFQVMDGLSGAWAFNVEQTMPEYRKGKVVFEEGDEEEYTGRIEFDTGRVISISSVDVEADTVTFRAYVDGGLVTTICTIEGNELIGSVRTPDGMLPFEATREE